MGPPFNGAALRPGFSALRARKVLKIDRPSVGGFGGLTAAAPLRVVVSTDGDEYIYCLWQRKPYNRPGGRGKTNKPPCGRWKCTPFGTFGTTFPPEGELLAVLCNEVLMIPKVERRADFPLRGKWCVSTKRGAFPRAEGAVVRFSIPRSGIIKLIARRAIPPPFEPACRRQAEPSEPFEPSRPLGRVQRRYHNPQPRSGCQTLEPSGP